MRFETRVKQAIYEYLAREARAPELAEVARLLDTDHASVRAAYAELAAQRLLVLEEDGVSIRMAPPFSGVPTQHVAHVGGRSYFANCAWDVFGIVAALGSDGRVGSRCEQSGEPLELNLTAAGPDDRFADGSWRFHCALPARHWWDDIVYT